MADPIKKVTLKDGSVRYRFVVDIGRDPETNRRLQKTHTFDTRKEANAEYSRIRHQTNQGTYVRPRTVTVGQYLTDWMEGATRDLRPSSRRSYQDALRPVFERLGEMTMQGVTKADVERLVTWMLTSGRRRGGPVGSGLGPRSVQLTLGRLSSAFDVAVDEGVVARNVVRLVKKPSYKPPEPDTWSKDETRTFLRKAGTDRLHGAWRLSLYGLRRGEVLGLRWAEDVDFASFAERCRKHREPWCAPCYGKGKEYRWATVTVQQTRILVEGRIQIGEPKSDNGRRALPLDATAAAALRALRVAQRAEAERAGASYVESGYVVTDELGEPVGPEWYSDEFRRLTKRAGLPVIVLHEGRHTTLSLMEKAGVPISIISKWAGHYDTAFTYSTYVHAKGEDLQTGADALGVIYRDD